MSRRPRFSIVLPTRNRARLLARALRSACAQTVDDVEILVSDNASADDTAAVAEATGDPRVRVVRTPRPLLMHESWRFAVAHARGACLTILCDDDALHPEALALADDAARATGAEVVSWRSCSLVDPACTVPGDVPEDVPGGGLRLRFGPPYADRAIPLDGAALLDGAARLEITTTELAPKALNCLWRRSLLERAAAAGTSLFHPACPDYAFMLVASALARGIVLLDAPLLVAGATPASIGASAVAGGAIGRAFLEELRAGVPDLVPPPAIPSIVAWTAQTFLQCARDVPALRGRTLAAVPGAEREDHLRADAAGAPVLGLGAFRVPPRDPGDAPIDAIAAGLPAELAARGQALAGLWDDLDRRAGERAVVLYGLGLNGRALLRCGPPAGHAVRRRLVGADDAITRPPRGLGRMVPGAALDPLRHFVLVTPDDAAPIVARLAVRGFVRERDVLALDGAAAPALRA